MFFDSVGLLCEKHFCPTILAGLSVRKLLDLGVTMPRGPDELRWRFLCKMGFLRLVDF